MAMLLLQLLIIMNYSRRKVGFLRVNCRPIFIDTFDTGPDPTRPPKTDNFVTQPDPWMDPTHVHL